VDLLLQLGFDVGAFATSFVLVAGYHLFLAVMVRRNPLYTAHRANIIARRAWVEHVMSDQSKDVMAVQTFRNSIMAASFLGSTAVLLIIATLTLISQSGTIGGSWHALSLSEAHQPEFWLAKVLLLLLTFIVAFFSFAMMIRLLNHVLYMVNIPSDRRAHPELQPDRVAERLNRAGFYYTVGMRAYYIAVPLVFWLFGPYFLLAASIILVVALYRLDRSPHAADEPVNDNESRGRKRG
jgi:uncharacterized membrane protein